MNNYVVFVFAFLLGSLVFSGIFISVMLYFILQLERKLKDDFDKVTQGIDELIMKHDAIAEWMIDNDSDCDFDDPHALGNPEDMFGSVEDWKKFYGEDLIDE